MPVVSVSVAGGLVGTILFLLGTGIIIYILWKKRCVGNQYDEISTEDMPKLVYKTTGNQAAVSVNLAREKHIQRTRSIPFVIPPKFHSREWVSIENGLQIQDDSESYIAPDLHSSSFQFSGVYAFGTINPDLYKFPEEANELDYPEGSVGRLWFVVEYENKTERLLVTLIKARNLHLSSPHETCNPFVKLYLLPDERRHLQSKVKQKTKNPQFNEKFVFQVSGKTLHHRTLKFSVCTTDKQRKHHTVGEVTFPLKNEMQHEDSKLIVWKDLEAENLEHPSAFGDLQFSMSYNEYLGRLTLVVLRARGLQLLEEERVSNLYVKVTLMNFNKLIKSKKTAAIQGTKYPVFNETLSFKLGSEELSTASLCLSVHQRMENENNHLLGRVAVGPFMYARGRELEHWNDMINRPKELVKQWHALTCSM